jgi:hypothetical protein
MSITASFKDEAEEDDGRAIGPVIVTDHEVYDKDPEIVNRREGRQSGVPFGYKPQGVTDLGWKTRREALAVAAEYGVPLTDY